MSFLRFYLRESFSLLLPVYTRMLPLVDVDYIIPLVSGKFLYTFLGTSNSCVIDKHIYATKRLDCMFYQRRANVFMRYITYQVGYSFFICSNGIFYIVHCFGYRILVSCIENYLVSFFGEFHCYGLSYSLTRTSNHRTFSDASLRAFSFSI